MAEERFKLFGCVLCLILHDSNVLMALRKNKFDAGNYNLVGGRMEQGETVIGAAIREIGEETGLIVKHDDAEVVGSVHCIYEDGYNSIEYVVVVKEWSGQPVNLEPEVCERLDWVPVAGLPSNVTSYARLAIENYLNGIIFGEFSSI